MLKLTRPIAIGAVLIAAFGGITAAVASRNSDARDQLHHIDVNARDLVPVFAGQMIPGDTGRNGYAFDSTRGSDQLRAMMAVGAFAGEAHALSETLNRYPNASLGGALQDFDRAYQSADQWIRYADVNRDVDNRWSDIRNIYSDFRQNINGGPGNGGPDYYPGGRDDRGSHGVRPRIDIHVGR